MTEARKKYVHLDDVDEDTFARFIEYLYTDDYSVPEPDIILKSSDIDLENDLTRKDSIDLALERKSRPSADTYDPEPAESVAIDESCWGFPSKKDKKRRSGKTFKGNSWHKELEPTEEAPVDDGSEVDSWGNARSRSKRKKDVLWSAFKEKAVVKRRDSWEPRQGNEACEDYTNVFLCHARLYVLSDRYGVEALQRLTRQKLRVTLARFSLFKERVPDVVQLVRYTYENTMDHEQGIDKLRSLVMDYIVCHLEMVADDKDFREFLQEPGALAKDLVVKSLQRLD